MKATIIVALVVALGVTSGAGAAFVVTSKNIKNGTIRLVDISPRAKAALRGQRGPRGEPGAPGAPGVSSITEVTATLTILPSGRGNAVAACPAELAPISGGYLSAADGVVVQVSRRSQQRGWEVGASGPSGVSVLVYAYCAPGVSN